MQLKHCYIQNMVCDKIGDLPTLRELALNPGTTSGRMSFFPLSFSSAVAAFTQSIMSWSKNRTHG